MLSMLNGNNILKVVQILCRYLYNLIKLLLQSLALLCYLFSSLIASERILA